MFENPFKKNPASKVENLEAQLKAERMKLMSNEEKTKMQLELAGGLEGLERSLKENNSRSQRAGEFLKYGSLFATGGAIAAACMIFGDVSPETIQRVGAEQTENFRMFHALVGTGFTVAGTALASSGAVGKVKNWWEKRKLETLKDKAVAQGIAG